MGEGEPRKEGKKCEFSIFAFLMCLIVIASIVLAPNIASLGTEIMSVSDDFDDVALNDIINLDKKSIDDQILKGEIITLYIDGQKVSFKLVENDIRTANFALNLGGGLTLTGNMAKAGVTFYKAMEVVGADFITATFTSGKMHFAMDMPDGKTYFVDALDGTGKSGQYLVHCSDDVAATEENDQNGAVTIPVSRGAVDMEDSQVALSGNDGGATSMTNQTPTGDDINITTQEMSERTMESGISSSTGSANNNSVNFQSMQLSTTYPSEVTTVQVVVALIADYEFSTRSTWISDMLTTFYDVQGRMESQTGLYMTLTSVDQTPQTRCTSTDSATLLGEFQSWVTTYNPAGNPRDTSILFSAKTLSGGQVKAYETGTGLSKLLGSSYNGYGCVVAQQTFTQDKNSWLLGHGLGLSFNADEHWGQYQSGIGSWMWPVYAPSEMGYEPVNIQRMQSWMGEVMQNQRLVKYTTTTLDGLQVSNTRLITGNNVFEVGVQILACFDIKNTQSTSITLPSLYFGAVNSKGEIKDFGMRSNVVIGPGQTYYYWTYFTPDSGGAWTICPARYYNGNWGWFDLGPSNNVILHPTMYYSIDTWEGHYTSAHSTELFYKWGVYAMSQFVGPGDQIMTTYTMFNTAAGTSSTTYNWFFIEGRCPLGNVHDFGGIQNPSLSQKGNGYIGGGVRGVAYSYLNETGVWKLSPCYQTTGGAWGPWMGPLYIKVGIIVLHYGTDNHSAAVDNGYYIMASGDTVPQYLHPDNNMGLSVSLEIMELDWSESWDCPLMRFAIASAWYKNLLGYPYFGTNWAQEVSIYVGKEQGWDAGVFVNESNLNIPRYLGSSASVSGADLYYQTNGNGSSIGNDFRYPTGNPEQTFVTDVAIATTFLALDLALPGTDVIAGLSYAVSILQAANAYLNSGTFIHDSDYGDSSAASVKWTGVDDRYQEEQTTYNEVNLRLGGGQAQTYCFSIWADFLNSGVNSTPKLIVYLVP